MFDSGALPERHLVFAGFEAERPAKAEYDSSLGRLFDIVFASAILLFVAPLMIVLALTIALHDGSSPVFAQTRIGKNGRRFRCLKFRSMVPDAEARLQDLLSRDPEARAEWLRDHKLRRDPRITPFGFFLRKSSLDELPQLFNILRGDMSLVGPRPIVDSEIGRYGRHFRSYCAVRPGLTGLWQVSGRNDVMYRRRVAMDVLYSRTKSVRLDPKTVVLTFQTNPGGLQLTVNGSTGTSTFTRTVIVGSKHTISAPSSQRKGGKTYTFASWSDEGAQTHDITAPATATTYTARFRSR